MLRVLGLVYLVAVQLAWLVPSPVGTNISRLGLIFAGVGLVATLPGRDWARSFAAVRLGRTVAAGMVGAALITSVSWQVGLAARDAISTAPPSSLSLDLQPLVDQLQERGAGLGRVEVVPTASHREAAALAPYANLARGWNRQADAARNRVFYRDRPLTAEAYQHWLRRWAVRFVVLSTAKPDAAAVEEAALVAGGLPYLERVWSDDEWTLYEVDRPAPSGIRARARCCPSTPRRSRSTPRSPGRSWSASPTPAGSAWSTPGASRCRPTVPTGPTESRWPSRASRAWPPTATSSNPRDNWLVLHATEAGVYRIGAPYKMPRGSACS